MGRVVRRASGACVVLLVTLTVIASLSLMLMVCPAVAAVTPAGGAVWSAHPMQFEGPNSVSCVSADACTAVGSVYFGIGTAATGWDGGRWRMEKTPSSRVLAADTSSGPPDALEAVSCTSTKACIAVGEYTRSISYGNPSSPLEMPLAERWNGARWSLLPFPSVPAGWQGGGTLGVVSCTSGSACMAGGGSSRGPFSERWNGTRWTVERMPEPAPLGTIAGGSVDGLSCSSSTACIAIGSYDSISSASTQPFAERWNGNNWTLQPLAHIAAAPDLVLVSVSCTSARACIAVGESYPHPGPVSVTAAERWNGTSWSVQRTANGPGHYNELAGVSCASSRACTAVGDTKFRLANGGWRFQPLVERWDGTSWSIEHTPSFGDAFLEAVSCTSSTICTAIGGNRSPSGAVAVQRTS